MNFSRSFDLDRASGILSPDSAGTITASAETGNDLLQALRGNAAFPAGTIELGRVQLKADAGRDVVLRGTGSDVRFAASATAGSGIGIYDSPSDAVAALGVNEDIGLDLTPAAGHRYMLFRSGYDVSGSASATHPLGALGSLTAGVEAQSAGLFGILQRFPASQGAIDVIASAVSKWRLPSQVTSASQLAPGTWLLAETEGRLAVDLAAQVGYDFTFVRELRSVGLSGDVGLKLDAMARATFGFEVSGRYLLALGRDDDSGTVRLRLFKLRRNGHSFGLNLSAGLKAITPPLPDRADDFVQAVFGVHGQQVVKDLLAIEKWTDPTKDLSDTIAGLVNKTGLELLQRATGIDPSTAFEAARDRLVDQLKLWDRLPAHVQSVTTNVLEDERFRTAISSLADPDPQKRSKALAAMIADAARTPWLAGIADRGLLALLNRVDEVHQYAVVIQQILDGRVISALQGFIAERLNLEGLRTATSFDQVDGWLVQRLSQFLDERIDQRPIEEVRTLINIVVRKRQDVYVAARRALSQRYSASIAAAYSRTTSRSAVLDAEFDLAQPAAQALFESVLHRADYDTLLTAATPGVTLRQGMLSHGIENRTSVEVRLPRFTSRRDRMQSVLASVQAAGEGGRVLLYEMTADDVIDVRNRLRSELAVTAAFPRSAGDNLRVRSEESFSWSYRMVAVEKGMRAAARNVRVAPFLARYIPDASLEIGLDGDTILDMQVAVPGSALAAWFRSHSDEEIRQMSNRIRLMLKRLVPFYFHGHGRNAANGALQTWAAISVPPGTDHSNVGVRRSLVRQPGTEARLHAAHGEDANSFQDLALTPQGDLLLTHLLTFENRVVEEAMAALRQSSSAPPSEAVERLAEMGEHITNAFHGNLSSIYGGDALRVLGSAVFLEATCALDPSLRTGTPDALLRAFVLRQPRTYELSDYLQGIEPARDDIAAAQTLASISERTSPGQPPGASQAAAAPGSTQSRETRGR